jgi:alpha-beta hydrolase superfamily lysophospholipase
MQIVHGGLDTRTDPQNSGVVHEQSECPDKTLHIYDDANHQLFQDTPEVRERAMNDFTTWLLEHL